MKQQKHSLDFGKKEKVLNYACQTYQLSRPNKVGAVMALIRECQPTTIEEWEQWYFENAQTAGKNASKITKESLEELGQRLYGKITEVVISEWQEAFNALTKEDCFNYIYNLTINRTFDGRNKTLWVYSETLGVDDFLLIFFSQQFREREDGVWIATSLRSSQ